MKKFYVMVLLFILVMPMFSQVQGKMKGFESLVYHVVSDESIDSLSVRMAAYFMDTSLLSFLEPIQLDSLFLGKKFDLDLEESYIFVCEYDDKKALNAPYESALLEYRFSRIGKWMLFLFYFKEVDSGEFLLEYGPDKVGFKVK